VTAPDRALPPPAADLDRIADALAEPGWIVQPGFLDADVALALAALTHARWRAGDFQKAGVGRGEGWRLRRDVRGDHVHWIEDAVPPAPLQHALDRLEALRVHLNRALFAGLEDLETHLAVYPRGAFYAPHLDQFRDTTRRRISVVLYLNAHWRRSDGGVLRLWTTPLRGAAEPGGRQGPFVEILPEAGTLVASRSADFVHEVRRARRTRLSLTGWFLARGDVLAAP
jgi:SM-20-related protein